MPFRLRAARTDDVDALYALAKTSNMLNLPADRDAIIRRVRQSIASFAGQWEKDDPRRGEYMFVMDMIAGDGSATVIGTSAIIGQHGTRNAPQISFDVGTEENYSPTLDVRMVHKTLELVHTYEGPTEIGGLLLDPKHRKTIPDSGVRLGTQLSFVRFLYMAMRPERFQPVVIAEMMPPLGPGPTSPLWDALGAKFTGITYAEADQRWRTDKDFVEKLFPTYPIYVTLLPKEAQDVIGVVDEHTKPALKLLESVGFRYNNRVDPFDGGPHVQVKREEITLVKRAVRRKLASARDVLGMAPCLVGVEPDTFRAVATMAEIGETAITLPAPALAALGVSAGADAWAAPLG